MCWAKPTSARRTRTPMPGRTIAKTRMPTDRRSRSAICLAVAAKAVDQTAVAFVGPLAWRDGGPCHRAKQLALFDCLAARLFALFGLAIEGLCDCGGAALLA